MKKIFFFIVIASSLFLGGCASVNKDDNDKLIKLYKSKQFKEASDFLEKVEWGKKKENRLLMAMEKSRLYFLMQDYKQSALFCDEALKILDELYTVKISDKLSAILINENSDTFNGHLHERSMLYYFGAQSFLQLASLAKDKNEYNAYVQKARATLLAWDSFFQELNRDTKTKTLFSADILGKVLAANIHEMIGGNDRQIALQLYQDALELLSNQGPVFYSYAKNYEEFEKAFFKWKFDNEKIVRPQIEATDYFLQTSDYLKWRILRLVKKIRKNEYKKYVKKLVPNQDILDEINKENANDVMVSIYTNLGYIDGIYAKKYDYSLNTVLENMEDSSSKRLLNDVGIPVITYFALGPLGLGYVSQSGNTYIYGTHNVGTSLVSHVGIEFELPETKVRPLSKNYELAISVKRLDKWELYKTKNMSLVGPVNDVVKHLLNEKNSELVTRKGIRVGTKYAMAILAAYGTYRSMNGDKNALARFVALGQFLASSKAIAASEKADIRHWPSLPAHILSTSLPLAAGQYRFELVNATDKNDRVFLADREILADGPQIFSFDI